MCEFCKQYPANCNNKEKMYPHLYANIFNCKPKRMLSNNSLKIMTPLHEFKNHFDVTMVNNKDDLGPNIPKGFAPLLAHEIRNPLMTIKLALTLLELNIKNQADMEYINIIKRGCTRINNLVEILLKEESLIKITGTKQSIHEMLDEILDNSTDRIFLKKILVTKMYSSGNVGIYKNNAEIKIAIANLITNAVDAMPANGGRLLLTTKLLNSKFQIEIEDNGCGIKRENLKSIFLPYYTNKANGLGVGLTLTKHIFRANNINISVRSKEGHGTCFTLLFKT